MTPEERAELILVSIESVQDRDYRLGFIEQSIRDAAAKTEVVMKQVIQERDEAKRERNYWERQAHDQLRSVVERNEAIGKMRSQQESERDQARAALEPFARLAYAYDGWNGGGSTIVVIEQLRNARDAYLALGGKL